MNPLLTVIIPVYNIKKYLSRCLDSVINQIYQNLDIILIDDGSTDGSGVLCNEYQKQDSRIRVIHQKNCGVSESRNIGLKYAGGTLLTFADPDDWLELDAYNVLVNAYLDTKADILIFGYYRFYDKGKTGNIEKAPFFDRGMLLEKKEALNQLILDTKINNYLWNKIFTRDIFTGLCFAPGKLYEDILIMHKLFLKAEKISIVNVYKYYYFIRKDSISNSKNFNNELQRVDAFFFRFHDLQNNPLVNQEILLTKTAKNIIDIFNMFKFRIKGDDKAKMLGFLRHHRKSLIQYPLRLRDKLFYSLPSLFFLLFYNRFTVLVYTILKNYIKPVNLFRKYFNK